MCSYIIYALLSNNVIAVSLALIQTADFSRRSLISGAEVKKLVPIQYDLTTHSATSTGNARVEVKGR